MFLLLLFLFSVSFGLPLYSHEWAVKFPSVKEADSFARLHGMANLGLIVDGYYLLQVPVLPQLDSSPAQVHESRLLKRNWNGTPLDHILRRSVDNIEETLKHLDSIRQTPRVRDKRSLHSPARREKGSRKLSRRLIQRDDFSDLAFFTDPLYQNQWHLINNGHNGELPGNDINVLPVWKQGLNGSGITVSVIDDGVDFSHLDLKDGWSKDSSYDFSRRVENPAPQLPSDTHGTRCAGEIAARPNNVCGVGVAYGANIAGERLVAESSSDAVEAQAFTFKNQINDIYSASWGPSDDGASVDGPGQFGKRAITDGVTKGRDGLGSIFIFASGNGGKQRDNCNFDGYANSIYTVSVGAITWSGKIPWYGEECSAHLGVVYSGGEGLYISTTDVNQKCSEKHSGTSAAAPLVSGIVALMLSARPELGWRDIQQLIVETAEITDKDDSDWVRNGAGRMVSHKYGFGKLNAEKLVQSGREHSILPSPALKYSVKKHVKQAMEYNTPTHFKSEIDMPKDKVGSIGLSRLEHVQVTVYLTHEYRGNLRILLVSPAGTESLLAAKRPQDHSPEGFNPWTFMTIRNWGESPVGIWTLKVQDGSHNSRDANGELFSPGYLSSWELTLHGSCESHDIVESTSETSGRQVKMCVHTVQANERVQRDVVIGLICFLGGCVVGISFLVFRRYHLRKGKDKYVRDDAESPALDSPHERIALLKLKARYNAESPALSTAQDRLASLRPESSADNDSGSEYSSDGDEKQSPVKGKIPDAATLSGSTRNLKSHFNNAILEQGGIRRTNSVSKPLNVLISDSSLQKQEPTGGMKRSSSSVRIAVSSDAVTRADKPAPGLWKAQSLGDLMKSSSTLTRSRSGLLGEKNA